ncbi:MAG: hypothetical protein A2W91_06315 [Bacteroidetes bacterium GWF2_38_335]|nr:MAG: hypothetical protein A2W91_06315 [Bacteroidetes bacterium GWF2_38_335]HBS89154.1 hypothetical protein [Bacteroidales bacterium]
MKKNVEKEVLKGKTKASFMSTFIVMCDFVEKEQRESFVQCIEKIMFEFNLERQKSNVMTFFGKNNLTKQEYIKNLYHELAEFDEYFQIQDSMIIYYYRNDELDKDIDSVEIKPRGSKGLVYYRLLY